MAKHPIRTSPTSEPFLGTCACCKKENITIDQLSEDECSNPTLTKEQAILRAILDGTS